ncbi:MAG: Uncharacterised protein [Methanobacteriota archaeon]|nr:MAG: Uncharacterised protein [Euryarchaeota archaeon]
MGDQTRLASTAAIRENSFDVSAVPWMIINSSITRSLLTSASNSARDGSSIPSAR